MIPKRFRGITREEADTLFKTGKEIRFSGGFLKWKETTRTNTRVVVSVAKRAATNAVGRARIRRKVQAALHPLLPHLHPVDILVVWTGAPPEDTQQLEREFSTLLQRKEHLHMNR